jgi:hypothetical protein
VGYTPCFAKKEAGKMLKTNETSVKNKGKGSGETFAIV